MQIHYSLVQSARIIAPSQGGQSHGVVLGASAAPALLRVARKPETRLALTAVLALLSPDIHLRAPPHGRVRVPA